MRVPVRSLGVRLLVVCLIAAAVLQPARPVWAAGVVGDGSAASCDNNALAAALAGGGLVTFDCGGAALTIIADTYLIPAGTTVTVDGGGLITLDGESTRQIFSVEAGADLTLQNITLTQGYDWGVAGEPGQGGAIYNAGSLTLRNATIRDSQADGDNALGGAIYSAGALSIIDSHIEDNAATFAGGGIDSAGSAYIAGATFAGNQAANYAAIANRGTMSIIDSTVSGNTADDLGGGIGAATGELTVLNTTITGNTSAGSGGLGGGMAVISGTVTIDAGDIVSNTATWGGGGLYVNPNYRAVVTVRGSRISYNKTTAQEPPNDELNVFGGGVYNGADLTLERVDLGHNRGGVGGGLMTYSGGKLTVRESAVHDNVGLFQAGGLWLDSTEHSLTNVTVSGNSTTGYAGGILVDGPTALVNVTVANNQAVDGANLHNRSALTLTNTLLAAPVGSANCGQDGANGPLQPVTSNGHNLASDEACNLTTASDWQATDPLLGALADNGGPTLTHALGAGSPAIDQGDAAACPLIDQRGFARTVGAVCDIGALEVTGQEAPAPPPVPVNLIRPAPYVLTNAKLSNSLFVRPIDFFTKVFPYLLFPDIETTLLEVTQGVHGVSSPGVTLIAGKRTYVRVHVKKTLGSTDPVVGARLWRIVNGQRVGEPLRPSNGFGSVIFKVSLASLSIFGGGGNLNAFVFDPTITVRANPDRNAPNDSFYFLLPAAWTADGSLTLEADVNPPSLPNAVSELDYADNVKRVTVSFKNTPPMYLRLVAVTYKSGNKTYTPTAAHMAEVENWLRRAYPISTLIVKRDATDMSYLGRLPTAAEVNERLEGLRFFMQWGKGDVPQTHYYGLVWDGDSSSLFMRGLGGEKTLGGVASGPTGDPGSYLDFAWDDGNDGASYGDWYAGHELGHTFGLAHVLCRGDEGGAIDYPTYPLDEKGSIGRLKGESKYWGFDVQLKGPIVYPPTWKDVMTYCSNQWISYDSYTKIDTKLRKENEDAQVMLAATGAVAPYLFVQGQIASDQQTATLGTFYKVDSDLAFPLPPSGPFTLRLRDAANTVLAEYPFAADPNTEDPAVVNPPLIFSHVFPFVAGTRTVEVVGGGKVLASRAVSANSPQVQVMAPVGGENVGPDGLTVTWQATDTDGGALTASVLYSRDGGGVFTALRVGLTGNSIVIPVDELGGTTQGKVRVVVSDGVNTGQADSAGLFSVPNQTPVAYITSPANGAVYGFGQTVMLQGNAVDAEDTPLPASAFAWSSDLDGSLGTGPILDVDALRVGTHVLTLQVTDSASAAASVTTSAVISNDIMLPAAGLMVAPASTGFAFALGEGGVRTQTVSLRAPGEDPVTWNAASDQPWLTVAKTSGGTPDALELRATAAGLAAGVYTAKLTLTAKSGATNLPSQTVLVTLNVVAPPDTARHLRMPLLSR